MSDEKKLKETFDFKSTETKKVLRKAKLFTIFRTVIISLLVFIIVLVANEVILTRIADDKLIDESFYNIIAGPNTYISHSQFYNGFLLGEAEYITTRVVGNKSVFNGTHKIKYSIIPFIKNLYGTGRGQLNQITNGAELSYYNKVGNKEMIFFHPSIEYETYPNDLTLLDKLGQDKYLEMALSFNQDYSLEEVQALIPSEVKIAWYWVDTYSEQNLSEMKSHSAEEANGEKHYQKPRVLFANNVYGIKAIDSHGEKAKDPESLFIGFIKLGCKNKGPYQSQFKNLYNVLSNGKGEITKDDLRIIGVVVTGDTDSMNLLKNNNSIKATTLGIQIDKY